MSDQRIYGSRRGADFRDDTVNDMGFADHPFVGNLAHRNLNRNSDGIGFSGIGLDGGGQDFGGCVFGVLLDLLHSVTQRVGADCLKILRPHDGDLCDGGIAVDADIFDLPLDSFRQYLAGGIDGLAVAIALYVLLSIIKREK